LRTENPFLPYFAASVIIVFTPVFFPFAIVVYRVIRPQERIGEVYERTLAEEALLAEVEAIKTCPTCSRRVHDDWIICPTCRTRLHRVCPNCERLIGLDWSLCAWCGKDFERREVAAVEPLPEAPERLAAIDRDATGLGALASMAAAGGGAAPLPDPATRPTLRSHASRSPSRAVSARTGTSRPARGPLPEP
ncbi:MAG TPA: zinc ribbon domain-containing protein, partial [Candidatus Limnocylindrales bacterium]